MEEKARQKSVALSKKTIIKLVKEVNFHVTVRTALDFL